MNTDTKTAFPGAITWERIGIEAAADIIAGDTPFKLVQDLDEHSSVHRNDDSGELMFEFRDISVYLKAKASFFSKESLS